MSETTVIWHEVECGSYAADLSLWEELAQGADSVLDLGCGSGRVGLHLARRGHRVLGLDREPALVAALTERAGDLPVEAAVADAREFDLGREFGLVLAPMQLLQLFDGPEERGACLRAVAAHLAPGGVAAFAIVESMPPAADGPPLLPDAREVDGWVFSSLPLEAAFEPGGIRVRRLRQTVSPGGELSEEPDEILLRALDAPTLEAEAEVVGLQRADRRTIPATDAHVGSTAVLLERRA